MEEKEKNSNETLLDIEADEDIDAHGLGEKIEVCLGDFLGISQGPLYIKKVGKHIEIGKAEIHCIE